MLARDGWLTGLVANWKSVTSEECNPVAADLKSQRSAVFCNQNHLLATFDSLDQQKKYREAYIALEGSGPDHVIDGDGWSIYTTADVATPLAQEVGGEITVLSDGGASAPAAAKPADRPVKINCGLYPPFDEYTSLAAVWENPPSDWDKCYAGSSDDLRAESEVEKKSLEISRANWGDSIPDADALETMLEGSYSMCASKNMGTDAESLSLKTNVEHAKAAMTLCPEHPDMKAVKALVGEGQNIGQLKEAGRVIEPGTHKVGKDVQPGTYVAESDTPMEGCYWEATSSSGEVIDNEFVNSAYRVEMTIPADAYSVMTTRCEDFYPAG